jgi:hypothetical protein
VSAFFLVDHLALDLLLEFTPIPETINIKE